MKNRSASPISNPANHLVQRISALVDDYETAMGCVPVWCEDLKPEQALGLIAACLRIGLRLPPGETLHADMIERAHSQRSISRRGSTRG